MFDPAGLVAVDPHADEAALVARIFELERVKSAAAAGQARAAAALDERRRADQAAAGVPGAQRGRGLASEVGLARRDSPARVAGICRWPGAGTRHAPHPGRVGLRGALGVAGHPDRAGNRRPVGRDRAVLDAELYADIGALDGLGDNRISAVANQIAHRLDAQAVRDQAVTAAADRRLTIRPGPDAMTYVTALLPVTQGAGVYAALNRAADSTVDHRPRGAVMADTLVQRVTAGPPGHRSQWR